MAMVWSSWRCKKMINLPNSADKWDMCMTLQSCVTGHIWYKVNGNHGGWQCKPSRYRFVRQQVTTLHECTANQSNHGLQQRSSWPGVLLVAMFGRNFDGHVPRFNTLQSASFTGPCFTLCLSLDEPTRLRMRVALLDVSDIAELLAPRFSCSLVCKWRLCSQLELLGI